MAKDRMTSADLRAADIKKVYEYAMKNAEGDRLTTNDIKTAQAQLKYKKGGGMAIKGMGAAYKKGGMTKARAGKMMNLKMVAKKKNVKKNKK